MNRVLSVHLGLGFGHVVFGAFFIRLEPELGESECGEQTFRNGFSFIDGDVFSCDDTGGGMIGSQVGCVLFLFAAEAAVNGEHADGQRAFVPHLGKGEEPAAGHMGTQGRAGGFRRKFFELGEDSVEDVYDNSVVHTEGDRHFMREVVSVEFSLFVAMQAFHEFFAGCFVYGTAGDGGDCVEAFTGDADVRARETADVVDSVEDGCCFRAKLAVDILFVDEDGYHCFVKAHGEVGCPEAGDSVKDRVDFCSAVRVARVDACGCGRGDDGGSCVPGSFEVGFSALSELFYVEFHGFLTRHTTRLGAFSSSI